MKSPKNGRTGTKSRRKRRYQAPRLGIYGDLRRLTRVKMGGMNDGAGKPMTRAGGGNA